MANATLKGGPTTHIYFSQRLRLHYADWGNEGAPPLLLVHGERDHCRNWDWVAQALRSEYHVIAPDLRGHGDSQWLIGGAYTLADCVYDIAQLVHQAGLEDIAIVGHSMGGAVSLGYAGLFPETVRRLVSIEGIGPPPGSDDAMPHHARLLQWVDALRDLSARTPKRYPTVEDAFERMRQANPHLSAEQARHLTIHGSNQNEDGTYSWKFDNYIRVWPPFGISAQQAAGIFQRIACPTLLIHGTESWASDPAEDGRLAAFRNARSVRVDAAGHWVHHDRLDRFLEILRQFLADG